MSMEPHAQNSLERFGTTNCRPLSSPFLGPITDLTPLTDPKEVAEFMAKVGCTNWLCTTTFLTNKYAQSRVSAYMGKPNRGALKAVNDILRYIKGSSNLGLGVLNYDPGAHLGNPEYVLHCDADNSGNPEVQAKRRAHYSYTLGTRNRHENIPGSPRT